MLPVLFVLAALGAGFAWAVASPIGSSPDDVYHQASIWCPWPVDDSACHMTFNAEGDVATVSVPPLVARASCYQFDATASAECQIKIPRTESVKVDHFDQGAYPGGFYDVMHLLIGSDPTRSILAMRAVNVALAVTVLGGIALLADRPARRATLWSVLVAAVPLGMFLVASVNPSAWAFIGVIGTFTGLHASLTSTGSKARVSALGVLAVFGAVLAAASRADSALYVVLASLLVLFLNVRSVWDRKWLIAAPAISIVVGLWSYLGSSQSAALSEGFGQQMEDRRAFDTFFNNVLQLPRVVLGMFGLDGGLGWLDTAMPGLTVGGMLLLVGGVVMVGIRRTSRKRAIAIAGVVLVMAALPLYMLQANRNYVGEEVQSRYLLPIVPILLAVVLIQDGKQVVQFSRSQAVWGWAALSLANAAALHTNIRRYTTGLDVTRFNLNERVEWWWGSGSPMLVWAVGSIAFAVLAWVLVLARRDGRHSIERRLTETSTACDLDIATGPRSSGAGATPARPGVSVSRVS